MKKRNKIVLSSILQLLTFIVLVLISKFVLQTAYVATWAASHLYCFIWVFALVLCIRGRAAVGWFLTIGNVLGVIVGQLLGNFIKRKRMDSMTEMVSAEMKYQLNKHYGVLIWILIVLIAFVLGELFSRRKVDKNLHVKHF